MTLSKVVSANQLTGETLSDISLVFCYWHHHTGMIFWAKKARAAPCVPGVLFCPLSRSALQVKSGKGSGSKIGPNELRLAEAWRDMSRYPRPLNCRAERLRELVKITRFLATPRRAMMTTRHAPAGSASRLAKDGVIAP